MLEACGIYSKLKFIFYKFFNLMTQSIMTKMVIRMLQSLKCSKASINMDSEGQLIMNQSRNK